jgi:hypothetical protein
MKAVRILLFGLAPVIALSCSSIAPVKINAGDQCFRCRRTITDPKVATEMIDGSFATKYRGPGCMAKYLVAHPDETGRLLVTDFTSGAMIAPTTATYVPVIVDEKTREGDYRAYALKTEAEKAARALNATPIDWATVLEQAR